MRIHKSLIISILTLAGVFFASGVSAQETSDLYVYGNVKDYFSRKKLSGVRVTVTQDGQNYESQSTSSNGKFEFFLPLDHVYVISYSKPGFVTKKIEFNSKNIPEEDRLGGFSMNPDMSLFEEMDEVDFSILDKPIGKAKYTPERGTLEFDFSYTAQIQAEIERMMKEVEKANDEAVKEEDQAAKDAAKLEEQFKKFMADGESDFTKKSFESAVDNFQGAVDIKKDDPKAKSRLAEAKEKLADKLAAAEEERKYNEFIDQADNARGSKNWAEAVTNYEAALGVRAKDKYATDEKKKAEAELDKLKEREADEAEVAKLINEGDAKVDSDDYQGAIDKYEAALDVIATHPEAVDKLAIAKKALDEYEAMAAERAAYESLIVAADGLFEKEDFKASISKYEAALNVMPKEGYPTDQIKKAEDLIAELEAQAKEEADRAARQGEFDALIASGDKNMAATSFDGAISDYSAALEVFTNDAIATEKLAAAEKAKSNMLAAAEADEQYAALINDADRYYDGEDWEASIEKYRAALDVKQDPYPTDQIAKAEAALTERDRLAEEERLEEEARLKAEGEAAELQAAFDDYMEAGDADIKEDSFESAISNYEGALSVFPDNADAQGKLDKARKAMEDMLAQLEEDDRKAAEDAASAALQAEFDALISKGDGYFDKETYEEAIDAYLKALEVIPGNKEAEEKIDDARNELERQRAAMDAETRRQAEEEEAAAEKAKRDQFNELVAQGDAAYQADTYQPAIDNYEEALEIYSDDKPTQKKLEKARNALLEADAEAQRQAEEEERLAREQADRDAVAQAEAERLAQELADREAAEQLEADRLAQELSDRETAAQAAADAEAARLAELQSEREAAAQAEAERLAQLEAERAAAERERLDKEAAEFAYSRKIEEADELFDYKDYTDAKRAYEEALNMRSGEVHPETRIAMIDLLMAEAEEAARLRAEREAQIRIEAEKKGYQRGPDLDSSVEEEIAARIAEERQKRLEEKWAANQKQKDDWAKTQAELRRGEGSRIEDNQDMINGYRERSAEMASEADLALKENVAEANKFKKDIQDLPSRYESEQQERILASQENIRNKVETQKAFKGDYYDNDSSYDIHVANVEALKESKELIAKAGSEAHDDKVEDSEDWKADIAMQRADRNDVAKDRRNELGAEFAQLKEDIQTTHKEKTERLRDENTDLAARKKRKFQEAQRERNALANERRELSLLEVRSQENYNGGKEVMDIVKSELANEFPQGVTEESFTEGNKDVIRRIVVVGNKATEYRKVTSVSGSYFFKNGRSISKGIWDLESDKVIE